MKVTIAPLIGLCFCLPVCGIGAEPIASTPPPRERILFDRDWKFALGNAADTTKDFQYLHGMPLAKPGLGGNCAFGAITAGFDDSAWRRVDLPHDWANELPFCDDPKFRPQVPWRLQDHGYKPVGPYFPESSIGWYRKSFELPKSDDGRRICLEFDGVFRDAELWVNTHRIGRHEGGYTGFRFDITDYLHYGGKNVLALRVDASKFEGWFYEGAGIYRHVWLEKTNPVHVAPNSLKIVADGAGKVVASVSVAADSGAAANMLEARVRIVGANGKEVAMARQALDGAIANAKLPDLIIPSPKLWSLETPNLYRYELDLVRDGVVIDQVAANFGVRTLKFDPDHGVFLNGKHVFIKGACMHQDAAGVGVAVPDALLEWRLRELKKWGFNAYRATHHCPAPELLDLCDRLGILVMDENRCISASPDGLRDLRYLVERDRNHPSVIYWSLGNEEAGVQGSDSGRRLAGTMKQLVHALDGTRPVTYGCNGGENDKGVMSQVDVFGVNYTRLGNNFDKFHKEHPQWPMIATEEASTVCTRGSYVRDAKAGYTSAYDAEWPGWGKGAEQWMKDYATRPWLSGAFVWTGFDYRGEPIPFSWPCISSHFGVLDTCGLPKDNAWYYRAWWTAEPVLHLLPHWNWPGKEGKDLDVRCFSNHDEVELLLNGVSLGRKPMPRLSHLAWKVKYAPGKLVAKGYRQGKIVQETEIASTGPAAQLKAETTRQTLSADGRDCAVINVSVCDAAGRVVPTAGSKVSFKLSSNARILGVGNGDPSCHEADFCMDDKWMRSAFNGYCQVIVAAPKSPGPVTLTISAEGLTPADITLTAE